MLISCNHWLRQTYNVFRLVDTTVMVKMRTNQALFCNKESWRSRGQASPPGQFLRPFPRRVILRPGTSGLGCFTGRGLSRPKRDQLYNVAFELPNEKFSCVNCLRAFFTKSCLVLVALFEVSKRNT